MTLYALCIFCGHPEYAHPATGLCDELGCNCQEFESPHDQPWEE